MILACAASNLSEITAAAELDPNAKSNWSSYLVFFFFLTLVRPADKVCAETTIPASRRKGKKKAVSGMGMSHSGKTFSCAWQPAPPWTADSKF